MGRLALWGLPYIDAAVAFVEGMKPTERNGADDRITDQLNANLDPAKSLEELQTPPTKHWLGYEQHHIVEQNQYNVEKDGNAVEDGVAKFGRAKIDDADNVVWVPRLKHERITSDYNSRADNNPMFRLTRHFVNYINI